MSHEPDPLPRASVLLSALIDVGVSHVIGLPDNGSAALFDLLEGDPAVSLLTVTREGEAFAIASGLWLGGQRHVVLIQNTGLLESGDSLRGTATRMGVPLLCLVGYRGYDSLGGEAVDGAAVVTEPTLSAWQVPFRIAHAEQEIEAVEWAFRLARAELRPVAVLTP